MSITGTSRTRLELAGGCRKLKASAASASLSGTSAADTPSSRPEPTPAAGWFTSLRLAALKERPCRASKVAPDIIVMNTPSTWPPAGAQTYRSLTVSVPESVRAAKGAAPLMASGSPRSSNWLGP
jgi:hypothetical protein